jgi:hypothetical protein
MGKTELAGVISDVGTGHSNANSVVSLGPMERSQVVTVRSGHAAHVTVVSPTSSIRPWLSRLHSMEVCPVGPELKGAASRQCHLAAACWLLHDGGRDAAAATGRVTRAFANLTETSRHCATVWRDPPAMMRASVR